MVAVIVEAVEVVNAVVVSGSCSSSRRLYTSILHDFAQYRAATKVIEIDSLQERLL